MTGDGIPVPVPKGFTASSVESERYVNHNVTKTGTLSDLTFSSSGDYPWTQNADDGVWVSGNYHVANSTSELVSNEFTVGEDGGYLSVELSVSSQKSGAYEDALTITITNKEIGNSESTYNLSGTVYGSSYSKLIYPIYNTELKKGKYIISIKYIKDYSGDYGLDAGYLKNATIVNYDSEGSVPVTVHEYGGFVIYEGDGEINNLNQWNESKSRNQFVWIPVKDISRVCETDVITGKKKAKLWNFTYDRKKINN